MKGNGITLGMTDGTTNFGTVSALTSGLYAPRGDIYGHAVQQFYSTGADRSSLIIGVTTDSSKSGIIVEPAPSFLRIFHPGKRSCKGSARNTY